MLIKLCLLLVSLLADYSVNRRIVTFNDSVCRTHQPTRKGYYLGISYHFIISHNHNIVSVLKVVAIPGSGLSLHNSALHTQKTDLSRHLSPWRICSFIADVKIKTPQVVL